MNNKKKVINKKRVYFVLIISLIMISLLLIPSSWFFLSNFSATIFFKGLEIENDGNIGFQIVEKDINIRSFLIKNIDSISHSNGEGNRLLFLKKDTVEISKNECSISFSQNTNRLKWEYDDGLYSIMSSQGKISFYEMTEFPVIGDDDSTYREPIVYLNDISEVKFRILDSLKFTYSSRKPLKLKLKFRENNINGGGLTNSVLDGNINIPSRTIEFNDQLISNGRFNLQSEDKLSINLKLFEGGLVFYKDRVKLVINKAKSDHLDLNKKDILPKLFNWIRTNPIVLFFIFVAGIITTIVKFPDFFDKE